MPIWFQYHEGIIMTWFWQFLSVWYHHSTDSGDLPLTTYHLPLTTYHLPYTVLILAIYHLPFTTYHLPYTAHTNMAYLRVEAIPKQLLSNLPLDIILPGPNVITHLQPLFTNFCNRLGCLSLASHSSLV